jgi:hypothetical protein
MELREECAPEDMDERETHWIAELRSTEPSIGYNRTHGGYTAITDEVRKRLSNMRKGAGNPMYGRKLSEEHKAKFLGGIRGKPAHNRGKVCPNSRSRELTHNGVTLTLPEWAHRLGIRPQLLHSRLECMSIEDALTKPLRRAFADARAVMVLTMLAEGATQAEVAKALGITRATVSAHKIRGTNRGLTAIDLDVDGRQVEPTKR